MASTVSRRDDAPTLDIVAAALAAGHFSVLCNALRAAALVDAWKGEGPFTLFAPTDAAFRKLPREALNALLKDRPRLTGVLNDHLLAGKIMARDLDSGEFGALSGRSLRIEVRPDAVRINDARIMKTDIEASNGVIHSIDTVLMTA